MKGLKPPYFNNKNAKLWMGLGIWALVLLVFSSCRKDEKIPDVSGEKINFQVVRFDSLLYHTDSSDIPKLYQDFSQNHADFLDGYIHVMVSPGVKVTDTVDFLWAMKNPGMKKLYDTTQMIVGDLSKQRQDLAQAFRYVKYYFPQRPTPTYYTYISQFGMGGFTYGEKVLATSLDFHLGKEFPYYDPMIFPNYIKMWMDKEHIVSDAMRVYANDIVGDVAGEQFLDYIISNGKVLYLLDHFLPTTPDSIFLNYTADQLKWCQENEYNMWSHFIHENLLYSTKLKDFRKLINNSPNSSGMPPEAPGRTGNYMGWQIIKAYMKRHPKTTLPQLMKIKDSKLILTQSKYKPKK
ncbi:MAG TPA: hypothetical protein ENK85_09745 [Saprospiraceae bacterium]|nr:hypothetical protein [Saprospiraceae bacterium]